MITVSKEDYLKAILEAESEGASVISATLAHWLSVSPPAVTMALRRLKKDSLVRVQGGEVSLTSAGRKIARKLTLRHHLIERLLEFLEERGIRPGARVYVSRRNYDQTLTLSTDAGAVSLGSSAAQRVWVHNEAKTGSRKPPSS